MIATSLARALAQLGDPALSRALRRGVLLALLLLAAASALLLWGLRALLPETVAIPWVGEVGWLDEGLGWAAVPVLLVFSALLMAPVAGAISSALLDDVAAAVEARHYPGLPPARPLPWGDGLREGLGAFALVLAATLVALPLSLLAGPLAPLVLVLVNGTLLGREWFLVAALRREGRAGAKALLARHRGTAWLAGCLLAVPLLVPVVNLLVPTLGAATFTHLYHRVRQS